VSGLRYFIEYADDPQRFKRFAYAVAVLALSVRLLVLSSFWSSWIWQSGQIQDDWNKLAINLVTSATFGFSPHEPTTQRGPIFPLIEIPLYLFFGETYAAWSIALLLLDTGTSVLLMLLGRKMWGNRAAVFAGLFHAIYLPVVYYTALISQFTAILPFIFLWFFLITEWDLHGPERARSVLLGLVCGILILSKTVYGPVLIGSAVALMWFQRFRRPVTKHVALMLTVACLVVAPWTYRNYVATEGKFVLVQSYFWEVVWQKFVISELDAREGWDRPAGRTLDVLLAKQRELYRTLPQHELAQLSGPPKELYYEAAYKRRVLDLISAQPSALAHNMISNTWQFWIRAENLDKTLRMAGMQLPFLGAALIGLHFSVKYRQLHRLRCGLILILILWAEHSVVFGWGRYSLDTVPILAFVFGTGFDAWLRNKSAPVLSF